MDVSRVSERLADEFVGNPLNYVTEEDLRIKFIELLREQLDTEKTSVNRDNFLESVENGYKIYDFEESSKAKQTYWRKIKNSSKDGQIDRIHAEVSVEKNKRIDVVVFKEEGEVDVEWVQSGSKRYKKDDVAAAIELKFVKNKRYFPKNIEMSKVKEKSKEEIKQAIDLEENSLYKNDKENKGDIDELGDLPSHVDKYLLIFSNNNYMYQGEEPGAEDDYNSNLEAHKSLGEVAREKIEDLGDSNNVNILYAHPLSEGNDCWLNSEKR